MAFSISFPPVSVFIGCAPSVRRRSPIEQAVRPWQHPCTRKLHRLRYVLLILMRCGLARSAFAKLLLLSVVDSRCVACCDVMLLLILFCAVFPHFCGLFMTAILFFFAYCAYMRNAPQIRPEICLPGESVLLLVSPSRPLASLFVWRGLYVDVFRCAPCSRQDDVLPSLPFVLSFVPLHDAGFLSGVMWGIAQCSWFVANQNLVRGVAVGC